MSRRLLVRRTLAAAATTTLLLSAGVPLASVASAAPQQGVTVTVTTELAAKKHKVLKRGSKGKAVKKVQRILEIKVTGKYTKRTVKAVKAFQAVNGMKATGKVNKATNAKLKAWKKAKKAKKPAMRELAGNWSSLVTLHAAQKQAAPKWQPANKANLQVLINEHNRLKAVFGSTKSVAGLNRAIRDIDRLDDAIDSYSDLFDLTVEVDRVIQEVTGKRLTADVSVVQAGQIVHASLGNLANAVSDPDERSYARDLYAQVTVTQTTSYTRNVFAAFDNALKVNPLNDEAVDDAVEVVDEALYLDDGSALSELLYTLLDSFNYDFGDDEDDWDDDDDDEDW